MPLQVYTTCTRQGYGLAVWALGQLASVKLQCSWSMSDPGEGTCRRCSAEGGGASHLPQAAPPGEAAHLQGTAAPVAEEQGSDATGASRNGGGHSDAAHNGCIIITCKLQL